ncbi:MAG: hypothetical protein WCG42_00885 [Parachlamydiaceae bacterium]
MRPIDRDIYSSSTREYFDFFKALYKNGPCAKVRTSAAEAFNSLISKTQRTCLTTMSAVKDLNDGRTRETKVLLQSSKTFDISMITAKFRRIFNKKGNIAISSKKKAEVIKVGEGTPHFRTIGQMTNVVLSPLRNYHSFFSNVIKDCDDE